MPRSAPALLRTPENADAFDRYVDLVMKLAEKYDALPKKRTRRARPPDHISTTDA